MNPTTDTQTTFLIFLNTRKDGEKIHIVTQDELPSFSWFVVLKINPTQGDFELACKVEDLGFTTV